MLNQCLSHRYFGSSILRLCLASVQGQLTEEPQAAHSSYGNNMALCHATKNWEERRFAGYLKSLDLDYLRRLASSLVRTVYWCWCFGGCPLVILLLLRTVLLDCHQADQIALLRLKGYSGLYWPWGTNHLFQKAQGGNHGAAGRVIQRS